MAAAAAEVAARPLMELGPLLEIIPAALVTRHPRRFPHEKAAPMKTLFATVLSISIAVALPGLAEARGGGHGGGWARHDTPPADLAEAAFSAGAALAALSSRVHAAAPWSGVWRRRLALKAAAASARMARRGEDELLLRDSLVLCPAGGDPGPGGRLLLAWRELDRSDPLADESVLHLAKNFGLSVDGALRAAIAGAQEMVARRGAPFVAADTVKAVLAHRPDAVLLGLWLADAVLARRLGWLLPVPLLAAALLHPSLRTAGRRPHPGDPGWTQTCCAAYALAAAQACDLHAELGRRAEILLAAAPQLRAKGAAVVIAAVLDDDAVLSSGRDGSMTARGRRRLFDRLVALGAVRELTGRGTFRLYGL
jgi:hypothetical protein